MKRHKWEEERRLWGGSSLSSHTRIWCFWLQDRQCCQGVRSRIRAEGESGKEEGRCLAFQGEQGLRLGVIQQSRFGGRLGKPLAAAKVWKHPPTPPPPPLPFSMCPCVRREEGIVMGIWCQTSKPFYSLHEPPGQNIELASQLSQWLGLSACFYSSHFLFHTKRDWNSKMLSVLFEHVNKSQCLRTPQWDFALSHTGVCMGMSCYVYIKTDPIYFINTCSWWYCAWFVKTHFSKHFIRI